MFPPFMESADVLSIAPLGRMSSASIKKYESIHINLYEAACEVLGTPPLGQVDQSGERARDRVSEEVAGTPESIWGPVASCAVADTVVRALVKPICVHPRIGCVQ